MSDTPSLYKLYGMEVSLFTGKARAYLRWKDVPFEEVLADRTAYETVIVPRVGFPVVPVVVTPEDETLQDTTLIIDELEARLGGPAVYPEGPRQRLASILLELYGDEWLVIPAMHFRWNYNKDWAEEEFGRNSFPDLPADQQKAIGAKLAERFAGFCIPLGITPETIPAIEQSYTDLLTELDAHFDAHDYLFGSRPSIGDFGLIGPLYAHLYRDPASGKIMEEHGPHVVEWVKRMQTPSAPREGDFLPNDEIPETLLPILTRMMREHLPVLESTVDHMNKWFTENPDENIPRAIGMHGFTLGDVHGQRMINTYAQWMLQRALDCYHDLNGEDRAAADELLAKTGGSALADISINQRVALKNFRLVREP